MARRALARLAPRALVVVLVSSVALIGLAAFLLGRSLSRPIEQLAAGMARYAKGDLDYRLPARRRRSPDELQYLVQAFNRMGDDLVAQRERLQVSEALAAWQGVARDLAHELRNPLTAMRMAIGRLLRANEDEPEGAETARRREALTLIESETTVLLRMAESFSSFAKLPRPELRRVELTALLREVCELYRPTAPNGILVASPPSVLVQADPALLRQAVGNLVKNAIEASTPADAGIQVELKLDGDKAQVVVSDDGPGIETRLAGGGPTPSLGTTKPGGSGLGLPIAYKIVHEHGGTLQLEPLPRRGTRATIVLPAMDSEDTRP
jgi:nitrogen fixation/metabolism regulation signal transduction histidine kinase